MYKNHPRAAFWRRSPACFVDRPRRGPGSVSPPVGLRAPGRSALFLVLALAGELGAGDFDVVINEVHYHALSGSPLDEYVEIFNRGGNDVDLGDWQFNEGIQFDFPVGSTLAAGSFLILSPDPGHTRSRYALDGSTTVLGPYSGRLDNGGELLALVNAAGDVISRFHYDDDPPWTPVADGLGPSLERVDPFFEIDVHLNWRASRFLDGTPGRSNSHQPIERITPSEEVLIDTDETWRFRRGISAPPLDWTSRDFDDSLWESGATGIGYADGDDRTVLDDMEGSYWSYAARKRFTLSVAEATGAGLFLFEIDYDDAFVAYLNGVEFARSNLGAPQSQVAVNQAADDEREAGDFELHSLPPNEIRVGENVIAVEIHNRAIDSSDASFIPRLTLLSTPGPESNAIPLDVKLNEIKPGDGVSAGFIEIYNPTLEAIEVSAYRVVTSDDERFTLPATLIPGRAHRSFSENGLGFPLSLAPKRYALLRPDGATWVDALDPRNPDAGVDGVSFGRVPDGGSEGFILETPSPEAANQLAFDKRLVINEIHYHPPFVTPNDLCARDCSDPDQWVELYNSGSTTIGLERWRLSAAVDFEFPPGSAIAAGEHRIVAASRDRFLSRYPGVTPALVLGDWENSLSHASETLRLRDANGNVVDEVPYGDGRPLNDEEPADGVDDGTFLGSDWPRGADGTGSSLELRHADLDNALGRAWAAGPVGGTPATTNAAFESAPAPIVGAVTHSPALPRAGESVRVSCRASAVGSIDTLVVNWRVEDGVDSGTVVMLDDGLSGDARAGDGIFGGTLAPREAGRIIAFEIVVTEGARSLRFPRPPPVAPYPGFEGPFYLYRVATTPRLPDPIARYALVLSSLDRDHLESRDVFSNVLLYGSFMAELPDGRESVRHLVGVRYRGSQTRENQPRSYKVVFPIEQPFEGQERINLNATGVQAELLAIDLFRRAGMPGPLAYRVDFSFQGEVARPYLYKEQLGGSALGRHFGDDADDGNLYRAIDPDTGDLPFQGDLEYLGDSKEDLRPYYDKRSNSEADDFSDIIELTRAFDSGITPDPVFAERIEELIDVEQWLRFLAAQDCIANTDGGIWNRTGEDYFLYRVPAESTRPDRGKWLLLPWDLEETFENPTEPLFRSEIPAIQRLMEHPRFAPEYYCQLENLRLGVFSRLQLRQEYRRIEAILSDEELDGLDTFVANRNGFLDNAIPRKLLAGAERSASHSGCAQTIFTTAPSITLLGLTDACKTRSVEVNGAVVFHDAVEASWEAEDLALVPGLNTIVVESLDETAAVFDSIEISIQRVGGGLGGFAGSLNQDTVWSPATNPHIIDADLVVAPGVTLTLEPGTIVHAAVGASLIVRGRMVADGNAADPVIFASIACNGPWQGIRIEGDSASASATEQILSHVEFTLGAGSPAFITVSDARVRFESCRFSDISSNVVDARDSRIEIEDCHFDTVGEAVHAASSVATILDSTFMNIVGDRDAVDFDSDGPDISRIERCRFENAADDGVDLGASSAIVRDNTFLGVQDKAISIEGNGALGSPVLSGNLIAASGTAIALKNGVTVSQGDHNTLVGNQEGIHLFSKLGASVGGQAMLHSMIIWQNGRDVLVDELSSVSFTHSDISQELWPGTGNISLDPRFADTATRDYRLAVDSPCIGSGRDLSDMGALPVAGDRVLFVRGDVDLGQTVNVADAIAALNVLYRKGAAPSCKDRLDANDDGQFDLADPVRILIFVFLGGDPLPFPYPDPGVDPTGDTLPCVSS